MLDKLKDSVFVVFDCETTGLDYRKNQIIELAGQKVKDGEVIEEFHILLNPSCPVEDGAYATHGLSNLFLAQEGLDPITELPKFKDFVGDAVLVGHNILTFDLPFLNSELRRVGASTLQNLVVDTLIMARKLLPQLTNHKLTTVASHFKVDSKGAHRAMVDVAMNRIVFQKMLEQYLRVLQEEDMMKKAQNSGKLL